MYGSFLTIYTIEKVLPTSLHSSMQNLCRSRAREQQCRVSANAADRTKLSIEYFSFHLHIPKIEFLNSFLC